MEIFDLCLILVDGVEVITAIVGVVCIENGRRVCLLNIGSVLGLLLQVFLLLSEEIMQSTTGEFVSGNDHDVLKAQFLKIEGDISLSQHQLLRQFLRNNPFGHFSSERGDAL